MVKPSKELVESFQEQIRSLNALKDKPETVYKQGFVAGIDTGIELALIAIVACEELQKVILDPSNHITD